MASGVLCKAFHPPNVLVELMEFHCDSPQCHDTKMWLNEQEGALRENQGRIRELLIGARPACQHCSSRNDGDWRRTLEL
jgi:hypothetical protein